MSVAWVTSVRRLNSLFIGRVGFSVLTGYVRSYTYRVRLAEQRRLWQGRLPESYGSSDKVKSLIGQNRAECRDLVDQIQTVAAWRALAWNQVTRRSHDAESSESVDAETYC